MTEKVGTYTCTQPCSNCPYRKDAPLKLWHKSEYEKLLESENQQLGSIYNCHKNNGSICVGWLMKQLENGCPSIMLRISIMKNKIGKEYFDKLNSPSPLYRNVRSMINANYPRLIKQKQSIQDLTKPSGVKNLGEKPAKSNYTIQTKNK